MLQESKFLYHEPCPKCDSRDNLGVWSDGHRYCFGCGYYTRSGHSTQQQVDDHPRNSRIVDHSGFISEVASFPANALTWLRKYGITDDEIQMYGILYRSDEVWFPLGKSYSTRYVGTDRERPKSRTFGGQSHKHFLFLDIGALGQLPKTCIFVEDCISAIKLARQVASYPCLGSNVPADALKIALDQFEYVGIWLDRDKATDSLRAALRASLKYGRKVFCIITELDPKDYDNDQISSYINEACIKISSEENQDSKGTEANQTGTE